MPKNIVWRFRTIRSEWHYQNMVDLATNDPVAYYSSEYYLEECGGCELLGTGEIPQKFIFAASIFEDDLVGKHVLDYSCGRGEFAGHLHSLGANVIGVDISPSALEIARQLHPEIRFHQIVPSEVPGDKFDLIFLMDVVEHIKRSDVLQLLPKLAHQLAPGGSICIHTNDANQDNILEIRRIHPEHITLFTARELAQAVTDAGMEVVLLFTRPRDEEGYVGGLWCLGRKPVNNMDRTGKKILIEYNATVGDQLCLTPVISEYRKRNPDDHITIKVTHPELYINNPHVDNIVWLNTSGRRSNYDSVYTIQLPVSVDQRKMTLQNASAMQLGFEIPVERHRPEIFLSNMERNIWRNRFHRPKGLLVGVAPYSGWFSREWPINRWKVVTDHLIANYSAVMVYIGKDDRPYPWLGFNMAGLTDLRELALLLEQCDLLLTVDNGVTHMAAALEIATVGVFGPVLGKYRASGYNKTITIQSTGCVGCYHLPDWTVPPRVCPDKHLNCIRDINPVQVINACEELLDALIGKV